MRKILFRGKRADNGEWVEGYYELCGYFVGTIEEVIYPTITPFNKRRHIVEPATVGQFTGLTDKNSKKIFEGDIVNVWWEKRTLEQVYEFPKYKAVIEFGNPNHLYSWGWQLKMIDDMPFNPDILLWVDMEEAGAFIEVIGNIHDNQKLLEV